MAAMKFSAKLSIVQYTDIGKEKKRNFDPSEVKIYLDFSHILCVNRVMSKYEYYFK